MNDTARADCSTPSIDKEAREPCPQLDYTCIAQPRMARPCRISCNGVTAESQVSAQQAWAKLHAGALGRSSGQEGLLAFGLKNSRVRQCIQELPNATHCETYSCWGEDSVPARVKLVSRQEASCLLTFLACTPLSPLFLHSPSVRIAASLCEPTLVV